MKKLFGALILTLTLLTASFSFAQGIDANTVFMAHMDGTDGSTSFIDSDPNPKTITPYGNAQIDTAEAVFDESGLFDGTGDGFTLADNDDFTFGTSGTIDFRVRFASVAGSGMFYQHTDGANAIYLQYYQPNNTLNFQIYYGGALQAMVAPTWVPVANTWYHIALVKNGSDYALYVNGTKLGNAAGNAWPNAAAPVRIGSNPDGTRGINGWLDEYRISKNARWTSNFTVPADAYSEPAPPPPPIPPVLGESENTFWADKAAMMDPNSYIYASGVFNITENSATYLLNGWQLTQGGDPNNFWYHRQADIENALLIPAGTPIQHVGSPAGYNFNWGYAYYSKPDLVNSDPRYEDGRELYYQRLEKLKTLTPRALKVKITQGHSAVQAQNAGTNVAAFPTDFENGLLVHFSTMDGSWAVLESNTAVTAPLSPSYHILNLADELDDVRSVRFTGAIMIPFKRSKFPTMRIGFGSVFYGACTGVNTPATGCQGPTHPINSVYPTTQTYPAYGQVLYYNLDELPEPW